MNDQGDDMYNPDDIEQAKIDIKEQLRSETVAQELVSELAHVKAFTQSYEQEIIVMGNITKQQRLEPLPVLLFENGIAYKVVRRDVFRDEDDEKTYLAEYAPLDDQSEAIRLHELSEMTLRYDPKDRNKWKYSKWLDESDDDVTLPPDATLYYTFRQGEGTQTELYKVNDCYYVVHELHKIKRCYSVSLSREAQDSEGVFSLDFAVECGIDADKQFMSSKMAHHALQKMADS